MTTSNSHTSSEIAEVIAPQFPETDLDTITTIVDRYKTQDTWKGDTIFEKKSFELLKDILKQSGELGSDVPYEKLVTTDYSKKGGWKINLPFKIKNCMDYNPATAA